VLGNSSVTQTLLNGIVAGKNSSNSAYNIISLNGSAADGTGISIGGGGSGDPSMYLNTPSGGAFNFRPNGGTGSASVVIDSTGVGIANTSPNYTLDAGGDINTTGAYRVNGTAGWDGTISPSGCTITVTKGIITAKSGSC
jgi:hypothetical protein